MKLIVGKSGGPWMALAACGCAALLLAGCAARAARIAPAAMAPAPLRPANADVAHQEPISVPQTQVVLPRPQPINGEAVAIAPPEPPAEPPAAPLPPAPKPRPAPRTESRSQATPATPIGPPPPPTSRRRIRPVESAAEKRDLQAAIANHQRQVQEILAKVRARTLSEAEKSTVERIQAFLEQAQTAVKDEDLRLAEALSSRALALCRDLPAEK